ncbi:MAG: hypothetical protein Tsb0020_05450 [Haliangiales bacterium]
MHRVHSIEPKLTPDCKPRLPSIAGSRRPRQGLRPAPRRDYSDTSAMASISTFTPIGSPAAATVARAGGSLSKRLP